MKVSLKDIADSLGFSFEWVKRNPLLFGEAVKSSDLPKETKVGLLKILAQIALINWSWAGDPAR